MKKIKDLGDEYRTKLNKKNKETKIIKKIKKELFLINNPEIIIKIGRPKKPIPDVINEKKANGRPRKFNLDGSLI